MYSQSTINRARTILRNAEQQQRAIEAARKQRAERTVKAAVKADKDAWLTQPATQGQRNRIRTIEKGLGYKPSTIAALGTGEQARKLWRSLVNEATAQGFKVNRRTGELS